MATDLLFEVTWTGSADLLFGGDPSDIPSWELDIAGTFSGISGEISASYDNAVWRGTVVGVASRFEEAGPTPAQVSDVHRETQRVPASGASLWQEGANLYRDISDTFRALSRMPGAAGSRFEQGRPVANGASDSWTYLSPAARPSLEALHQEGAPVAEGVSSRCITLLVTERPLFSLLHEEAGALSLSILAPHEVAIPVRILTESEWQRGDHRHGWGGPLPDLPPEPPEPPCYVPAAGLAVALEFRQDVSLDGANLLFLCPPVPPPSAGFQIPIQSVYIVQHLISVTRLSDGAEIPTTALSLSLDADSWAWSLKATLFGPTALSLTEGETLVVEINGNTWHFLVEDWTETREWGRRSVSLTGRSLTTLLDEPWQPTREFLETNYRTLAQLANQELPFGWGLTWNAVDWVVPPGVWTYQGLSPIDAISRIALAAGALVLPDPAAYGITIQPRYPIMPWDFAGATPALSVPEQAIEAYTRRRAPETWANGVYVQGAEVNGIQARVYRTGTAGDQLADPKQEALITHADGARALGSRILAGEYQQPLVRSVTLPMDDGTLFPLAGIGDLVEIVVSPAVRALVSAVSVSVANRSGAFEVRQILTLGEDSGNTWGKFRKLTRPDPLRIGTIQVLHAGNTATVELVGGGLVRVRGTGSYGDVVYVQNGEITGPAPSLPGYDLPV